MDEPSKGLEDYAPLCGDIRRLVALAQTRGMTEPVIARLLLDLSFEAALHADPRDNFNHIIWTNSEAKCFMADFHEKLDPKLDDEALKKAS
ncbi:hypothetical protein [uncultured Roseobacter sp.]|uniref:hypothetical protein n=1 Tax=uncultured Roseobacter sp. TaxID=114847 RepID=UPI00262B9FC4|nr:hypothetical protein [uncultured Roseobacter sp.]